MTDLHFEDFTIRGHRVGKNSWFPAIRELITSEISAELDEDDGLFIGYGMMSDGLPYTLQDDYDNPEEELRFKSVVLENEYLKAVFKKIGIINIFLICAPVVAPNLAFH